MEMAQIAKYVVTQPDPTFLDNTSLFDNAYAYFRIANAAAQIFEMQTAALRYELGDHHSFEFIEGAVQCPMAPELKSAFATQDECFAYYDPTSPASFRTALDHLDSYIAVEGPYDAVLAFSQGAALAATYIIEHFGRDPGQQHIDPVFKCAIFLSGGAPVDPAALTRDSIRALKGALDGVVIPVPVTNIWGRNDVSWAHQSEELSKLCEPKTCANYTHEGGHEVPSTGPEVTQAVHVIRRTVDQALLVQ